MPDLDPIPYYRSLAHVLHGPTLALVLTYLEIHHPPPQDCPEANPNLASAPIVIDCDITSTALGVSRRTLHIALNCLGAWWSTESERNRAARAGREFLNPAHSSAPNGYGQIKIYSVTGSRSYSRPRSLVIRRNYPKLASVLSLAGFTDFDNPPCPADLDARRLGRSVPSLPAILARVMPADWGDRRAGRWDRWRKAEGRQPTNVNRLRGHDLRKMLDIAGNNTDTSEMDVL